MADQPTFAAVQALHLQLRDHLMDQIGSGAWAPHMRIPSERELCGQFNVSRTTTRRTIVDLVHEGRLYTVVGKGTYVAPPPLKQELRPCTGFSEDLAAQGIAGRTRVLFADSLPAPGDLAAMLDEPRHAAIYRMQRLRFVAGLPVAIQTVYLPARRCPGLLKFDFATVSLFETLRSVYGLRLRRGRITISAALADAAERHLLGLPRPAAVLRTAQTTFLDDGGAVEYCESTFHPQHYELHATNLEDHIAIEESD